MEWILREPSVVFYYLVQSEMNGIEISVNSVGEVLSVVSVLLLFGKILKELIVFQLGNQH